LAARVRYILDEHRISPAVGTTWSFLIAAAMVIAASALALAQALPVEMKNPMLKKEDRPVNAVNQAPAKKFEQAQSHTIQGTVVGPPDHGAALPR
jgi:hypothetical protein